MKLLCLIMFALAVMQPSFAQFPVQVSTQLLPPYSLKLSDYSSGVTPKIIVTATNADLQQPLINVRLRLTISGQGITLRSKENVFYPIISLIAGIQRQLTLGDLAPYFDLGNLDFQGITREQYQKQGRLPDGFYSFCFEALEINSNQVVSRPGCTNVAITLSDPPMLNSPFNNSGINESDPVNITFSWTPRHLSSPNAAFNTIYDFQITELLDNGISPEVAFRTSPPLYQTSTTATVLQYTALNPLLLPGKRYGWRVRVRSLDATLESDVFKNNGFSELFFFTYNEVCPLPAFIRSEIESYNDGVKLTWAAPKRTIGYTVEYRNRNNINATWITVNTQNNSYIIKDLQPGANYEYRIGNACSFGGNIYFSTISNFSAPAVTYNSYFGSLKGNVSWAYKASAEATDVIENNLVSTTRKIEKEESGNTDNSAGTKKYPLKGALVTIKGKMGSGWLSYPTTLGPFITDENGDYTINSSAYSFNNIKNKEIVVTHPSGAFNSFKRSLNSNQPGNVILTAQSFELQPSVFISDYKTGNGDVSLEVLIKKSDFDANGHLKKAGFGSGPVIRYNNDDYMPLVKLTDGKLYKKLFYNRSSIESYVVKVTMGSQVPRFYPMPAITQTANNNGEKNVKLYRKTFEYKLGMRAEGKITLKDLPRRDVRVEIKVKPEDILSNKTQTTFTAVTNAQGIYSIYDLPLLKQGAIIEYRVTDASLSTAPFTETTEVATADIIKKDIILSGMAYTIVGRVLSETGKAISNALVTVEGTSGQTRTSAEGLYAIKVTGRNPVTLQIVSDGYQSATVYLRPNAGWDQTKNAQNATQWKTAIENTESVKAVMRQDNLTAASAELLNIGTGDLATRFETYFTGLEDSKGVYAQEIVKLTATRGRLSVIVKMNNTPVNARIIIGEMPSQNIASTSPLTVLLSSGKIQFTVSPIPGDVIFLPVTAEATIIQNNTTPVIVSVSEGYVLTGIVTEKGTNKKVPEAKIALQGLPYQAISNAAGEYRIIIPKENELRVDVSKKDFDTKNSTLRVTGSLTANFELDKRGLNIADIQTIANFPVQLDKVESLGNNRYSISGKLTVGGNDIFTPRAGENKLTFKNAMVTAIMGNINATPVGEILFEEATLQTSVFGFGIVEVRGAPQLIMKGLGTGYEKTVIGGANITLKLSSVSTIASILPVALPDGKLSSADAAIIAENKQRQQQGKSAFVYLYTAPNNKINALATSQQFKINFDGTSNQTHVDVNVGNIVSFSIGRSSGVLSSEGINLTGFIQLPNMPGVKIPDNGKVTLEKFRIGKDYSLAEIKVAVSTAKPLFVKLQKIQAEMTSISFMGLGTSNMGVGFGGIIRLTKSRNNGDALIINEMSIAKVNGGVNLKADVAFGSNGLGIKALVFKTPGNNHIALSYNTANGSFAMEVSGRLEYDANRSAGTKPKESGGAGNVLKGVFPIEIQTFKLQTKDFALFLAAKANLKIDLKVAKVNINKFLVSIGSTGLSLDAMNQYLISDRPPANVSAGSPDELVDESKVSWAFGIHGGVEFDVKAVEVAAQTSFLIGNINDKIEFRLNEIELEVKCPSLEAKARVKLQFDDKKWGFEGAAKLLLAKKVGFEGSLKFYKIYAGEGVKPGIELGASFKVYAPVDILQVFTFYSGGGGFNLNTSENKYEVFLNCSFFPGPAQPVMQIRDAQLKVLFDLNACSGIPIPIIEGTGFLNIASEDWGKVTATLDVCKKIVMMKIEVTKDIAPGINMAVNGQMLGMVQKVNGKLSPAAYIGVSGQVNVGDILKGNVDLRMGINYNYTAPDIPFEVVGSTFAIPDYMWEGTVFNGIYLTGNIDIPRKQGGVEFGIAGYNALEFKYDVYANAFARAFYKYSNQTLGLIANVYGKASASVTLLGEKVSGIANANFDLNGGRAFYPGTGHRWWLNGTGQADFELLYGWGAGCNRVGVSTRDICTPFGVPYPCGCCIDWCTSKICVPIITGGSFKICKGLSAWFEYSQGSSPKFDFSLK